MKDGTDLVLQWFKSKAVAGKPKWQREDIIAEESGLVPEVSAPPWIEHLSRCQVMPDNSRSSKAVGTNSKLNTAKWVGTPDDKNVPNPIQHWDLRPWVADKWLITR